MNSYTKIDTIFKRDEKGTKKLIEGEFRDKNYMKCGYCNSFKALYMHINDYTRCPYDKESD